MVTLISITVNGTPRNLDVPVSITELVKSLDAPKDAVAVAVNESIVTRSQWSQTHVKDGDQIEVVTIYQGG